MSGPDSEDAADPENDTCLSIKHFAGHRRADVYDGHNRTVTLPDYAFSSLKGASEVHKPDYLVLRGAQGE